MSWLELCEDYNISYKRVSNENIEIKCCFCSDEHSKHKLGLNIVNGSFGCWRSSEYRGKNPVKAVQALTQCDWEEAKKLTKLYFDWSFEHMMVEYETVEIDAVPLDKPSDFLSFGTIPVLEKPFINYLSKRNLDPRFVIHRFDLHYCVSEKYADRIIIPVIFNKKWYAWTARDIHNDPKRYISVGSNETTNKITNFLFDEDNLVGGDKLLIVEGTFDAIKIASCLLPGIHATSLFGKQMSDKQKLKLIDLQDKYKEILLSLDKDAYLDSLKMQTEIRNLMPKLRVLAPTEKDWAASDTAQIKELVYG